MLLHDGFSSDLVVHWESVEKNPVIYPFWNSSFNETEMIVSWSYLRKLNFREELRTLRREWPSRSPKEKWQFLSDIPDVLLKIFGIRILSDCRVYWLSFLPSLLVLNYFGLSIYSLIYYARDGRFIFGTRCLCGIGIVSTVIFFEKKNRI